MPKKTKEKKAETFVAPEPVIPVVTLNLTDRLRPNVLVAQLDEILSRLDAIEKQLKNK